MIGSKPGQREPGRLRRWWTAITLGRHAAYLMVDVEKYSIVLPPGAVVREMGVLPTGTLVAAVDLTFAEGNIVFKMLNHVKAPPTPPRKTEQPPEFPMVGPAAKQ